MTLSPFYRFDVALAVMSGQQPYLTREEADVFLGDDFRTSAHRYQDIFMAARIARSREDRTLIKRIRVPMVCIRRKAISCSFFGSTATLLLNGRRRRAQLELRGRGLNPTGPRGLAVGWLLANGNPMFPAPEFSGLDLLSRVVLTLAAAGVEDRYIAALGGFFPDPAETAEILQNPAAPYQDPQLLCSAWSVALAALDRTDPLVARVAAFAN